MLIASYNPQELGDILVVITAPDVEQQAKQHQDVVEFTSVENGQLLGMNFLHVSEILPDIQGQGQVFLSDVQVEKLNAHLVTVGSDKQLVPDHDPKFVIGYVESMEEHPNSDHLHITKTLVDNNEELTIVSGSPNMQAHVKVVVAKIGAMMPSGLIIWPGELRGVPSNGMISSGRELGVKNAPNRPGALILPDDFGEVGTPFNIEKANQLF